ncbi:alpha/beta hydrolase [Paractinoplanes rishiriensis]|uniref:DUF1023 domain-containing protein n=1 Tax=Paractinoplanes rishiriensis TaxID=1050105 RepID=A0A919JZF7_9ACTN|nr:alpha/beta hydrolase [Actinoplanes rishiriensis]GIE96064.1 hypothetical protein Ari01nite_35290 [Actinoplanes rishiriensis]
MSAAAVYSRLRATDPDRWRVVALAWRRWAARAGALVADLAAGAERVAADWSGAAAAACAARLARLRRGLVLFRVLCWQADQAVSEFAAALARVRLLLARAQTAASRAGLTIDDQGILRGAVPRTAGTGSGGPTGVGAANPAVVDEITADLGAAVAVAARADAVAAARLGEIEAATRAALQSAAPRSPGPDRPDCTASPAEVARWWVGLDPAARRWLLITEPGWLAALDGLPAADRDAANRLLLDQARDGSGELRRGLDALTDRLADDHGPRTYLLRLDLAGDGRVVVALGDPDRADNIVTHVPGMTADLGSFGGELNRAARVAERAGEVAPAASTSAVLWLGYDAPDFVDEAAGAPRAEAGAPALRSFQEGLRAGHEGPPARQTLIGHSYGSLVVGRAAASEGLAADEVVFIGSPGVGVDAVGELAVPPDRVWATTSRTDIIQYAAVAPGGLLRDLAVAGFAPLRVLARPERDLWFGHNPSDPGFGARVFASSPGAGHLGYWDRGSPSLDALAAITLGTAR